MSWDEEIESSARGRPAEGRFVRVSCPACPSRTGKEDLRESLSLNTSSGWWRCFKCDARGRLPGYEDGDTEDLPPEPAKPPPDLPTVYPLAGDYSLALERHRDYLSGRGLPEWVWAEAGICAAVNGRYAGRVIVPVVPGDLAHGFVGRLVAEVEGAPKYLCPRGMSRAQLYNEAALLLPGRHEPRADEAALARASVDALSLPLLLAVEGVFDALAHWPDAVAFLGKPTEPQIELLSRTTRPVAVVLDPDAWREGQALCWRLRVRGLRAGCVVPPPGFDAALLPNDLLMAAGEYSLDTDGPVQLRK